VVSGKVASERDDEWKEEMGNDATLQKRCINRVKNVKEKSILTPKAKGG